MWLASFPPVVTNGNIATTNDFTQHRSTSACLGRGWLDACPRLVELEGVEKRNRLDDLVVTHREELRIGVRVRFAVPRRSLSVEIDDHGGAVGVQIPLAAAPARRLRCSLAKRMAIEP